MRFSLFLVLLALLVAMEAYAAPTVPTLCDVKMFCYGVDAVTKPFTDSGNPNNKAYWWATVNPNGSNAYRVDMGLWVLQQWRGGRGHVEHDHGNGGHHLS